MQDTPGYLYTWGFGSAIANGVHMSLCDGSVRMFNYTIDLQVYNCPTARTATRSTPRSSDDSRGDHVMTLYPMIFKAGTAI